MRHDLISPNLEKERQKKKNPSFGWKFVLTLVGNSCTLQVGYGSLVGNG